MIDEYYFPFGQYCSSEERNLIRKIQLLNSLSLDARRIQIEIKSLEDDLLNKRQQLYAIEKNITSTKNRFIQDPIIFCKD